MKFSLTALLDFLTKDIIKEDYGNQNFRHTQREREKEREREREDRAHKF